MQKNFTLEDIKIFLKEQMGLRWTGFCLDGTMGTSYATMEDFGNGETQEKKLNLFQRIKITPTTLLVFDDKANSFYQTVVVGNDTFILKGRSADEQSSSKLMLFPSKSVDYSKQWVDYLNIKTQNIGI